MIKRILITSLIVLLFLGSAFSYFWFVGDYCQAKSRDVLCNTITVNIADSSYIKLITKDEVLDELDNNYPVKGMIMDSIDLCKVERILSDRGEISFAEAYGDINGNLTIDIQQRKPIVRIENGHEKYYVSEQGFIFPVRCNVNVPIVTGHIPTYFGKNYKGYATEKSEKDWLESIISLCSVINSSEFLSKQIEQIEIEGNGELLMFTRTAGPKIIFGTPNNIENKFKKLEAYYKCIAPNKEDDQYKEINIAFKGQIVCK